MSFARNIKGIIFILIPMVFMILIGGGFMFEWDKNDDGSYKGWYTVSSDDGPIMKIWKPIFKQLEIMFRWKSYSISWGQFIWWGLVAYLCARLLSNFSDNVTYLKDKKARYREGPQYHERYMDQRY